jgi:hypothetical protein
MPFAIIGACVLCYGLLYAGVRAIGWLGRYSSRARFPATATKVSDVTWSFEVTGKMGSKSGSVLAFIFWPAAEIEERMCDEWDFIARDEKEATMRARQDALHKPHSVVTSPAGVDAQQAAPAVGPAGRR